jgi:ADP-ribosylglycohydrolase
VADRHEHPQAPEIQQIPRGGVAHPAPPEINGGGFVGKYLGAALWAFHRTDTFAEGAIAAVNLGDDADTTGAIYGQLAGAHYGIDSIPAEWLATLAQRDLIEGFAARLHAAASA